MLWWWGIFTSLRTYLCSRHEISHLEKHALKDLEAGDARNEGVADIEQGRRSSIRSSPVIHGRTSIPLTMSQCRLLVVLAVPESDADLV